MSPATVEHSCAAPASKWPQPGQDLPVRVDRADPRRLVILWDELPASRGVGGAREREQSRLLAEQMKSGQPPAALTERSHVAGPAPTLPGRPRRAGGDDVPAGGTQEDQVSPPGVTGDPPQTMVAGRPRPGMPGGLTPEQAAAMLLNPGGLRRATATVLAVHDVTSPTPPGAAAGVVDLSLQVSDPPGPSYPATVRIGFETPQRRELITSVGSVLPVLVDPVERSRVLIDLSQFRE